MYAYILFCCPCILKTSQPACDALRLWCIPRHDINPRREEWQLGNVRSCNYFALRLLADIVYLVSSTVLQNHFPAQRPPADRFKVDYVASRHDPTKAELLSIPVSLGSVWRPSVALRSRPCVASPDEDNGVKDTDMDRLEREVSSFPGFKSTSRLEALYTSQRLHHSYLVLLEGHLNNAAAPSCEKVLAALHLGKVRVFTSSLVTTHGCS